MCLGRPNCRTNRIRRTRNPLQNNDFTVYRGELPRKSVTAAESGPTWKVRLESLCTGAKERVRNGSRRTSDIPRVPSGVLGFSANPFLRLAYRKTAAGFAGPAAVVPFICSRSAAGDACRRGRCRLLVELDNRQRVRLVELRVHARGDGEVHVRNDDFPAAQQHFAGLVQPAARTVVLRVHGQGLHGPVGPVDLDGVEQRIGDVDFVGLQVAEDAVAAPHVRDLGADRVRFHVAGLIKLDLVQGAVGEVAAIEVALAVEGQAVCPESHLGIVGLDLGDHVRVLLQRLDQLDRPGFLQVDAVDARDDRVGSRDHERVADIEEAAAHDDGVRHDHAFHHDFRFHGLAVIAGRRLAVLERNSQDPRFVVRGLRVGEPLQVGQVQVLAFRIDADSKRIAAARLGVRRHRVVRLHLVVRRDADDHGGMLRVVDVGHADEDVAIRQQAHPVGRVPFVRQLGQECGLLQGHRQRVGRLGGGRGLGGGCLLRGRFFRSVSAVVVSAGAASGVAGSSGMASSVAGFSGAASSVVASAGAVSSVAGSSGMASSVAGSSGAASSVVASAGAASGVAGSPGRAGSVVAAAVSVSSAGAASGFVSFALDPAFELDGGGLQPVTSTVQATRTAAAHRQREIILWDTFNLPCLGNAFDCPIKLQQWPCVPARAHRPRSLHRRHSRPSLRSSGYGTASLAKAHTSPIVMSRSRVTPSRLRSANVTGRPISISKSTMLYISSTFVSSSRHNWVMIPKPTFSPCIRWRHSGKLERGLATMWAVARPPLSKPSPECSVLVSTIFSTAGVTTPSRTARMPRRRTA